MIHTTNKMVIDWAAAKGILGRATPVDQICKTIEEVGELTGAISKGDTEGQVDAIGDVWVTLIIVNAIQSYAAQPMSFATYDANDHTPKEWAVALTLEVGHLAGMFAGIAEAKPPVKMRKHITNCLCVLATLAEALGHDMQACLDHAYEVIANRTGRMVDGAFVRDAG